MQKMNNILEAVVLAGGASMRIAGETKVPKPLLPLGKYTLLGFQTKWLLNSGFNKVFIIASPEVADGADEFLKTQNGIEIISEKERRGTSGAVHLVLPKLSGKIFYLCNVDDLVLQSNPMNLILKAEKFGGVVLAAKPKIQFGMIKSRGDLVLGFREKPLADYYVSVGHYAWNLGKLNNGFEFPSDGNLEDTVLPQLAKQRKLGLEKYKGAWTTISTYKDYVNLCGALV